MEEKYSYYLRKIKIFCFMNNYNFDKKSFLILLKELDQYHVLNLLDKDFLNSLKIFPLQKIFSIQGHNLVSFFRLLLLPDVFYEDDLLGFYFTAYTLLRALESDCVNIDIRRITNKRLANTYQMLHSFEENLPLSLKASYGLEIVHDIYIIIIYYNFFHNDELTYDEMMKILYDIISNQYLFRQKLALNGMISYYYVNRDPVKVINYNKLLERIFHGYLSSNKKIIK